MIGVKLDIPAQSQKLSALQANQADLHITGQAALEPLNACWTANFSAGFATRCKAHQRSALLSKELKPYHLPDTPSTSPLIRSPVTQPSAKILRARSLSMASSAARALLWICSRYTARLWKRDRAVKFSSGNRTLLCSLSGQVRSSVPSLCELAGVVMSRCLCWGGTQISLRESELTLG